MCILFYSCNLNKIGPQLFAFAIPAGESLDIRWIFFVKFDFLDEITADIWFSFWPKKCDPHHDIAPYIASRIWKVDGIPLFITRMDFVQCKGIRIPESRKFLLLESGLPSLGNRNTAVGIWNPTDICNPETKFHWERSGIQ